MIFDRYENDREASKQPSLCTGHQNEQLKVESSTCVYILYDWAPEIETDFWVTEISYWVRTCLGVC